MMMGGMSLKRPCVKPSLCYPPPYFNTLTSTRCIASVVHVSRNECKLCHFRAQGVLNFMYLPKANLSGHYDRFAGCSTLSVIASEVFLHQNSYNNRNSFDHFPRFIRAKASRHVEVNTNWTRNLLVWLLKVTMAFCLFMSILVTILPTFLSSSNGLRATLFLINKIVPGNLSIKSVSMAWTKNVILEDVLLKGLNGELVVSVPKLETKASLWSLVTGKAGFGDCMITSPMIDLQQEEGTDLSRLALSVVPREKLKNMKRKKTSVKKIALPSVDIKLQLNIKAPAGGLRLIDGTLLLPQDLAAAIGRNVHVDILIGHFTGETIGETSSSQLARGSPLYVGVWSECIEIKVFGLVDSRTRQIQLMRPIKFEVIVFILYTQQDIPVSCSLNNPHVTQLLVHLPFQIDLTPEVGRIHLKRISPLLGNILGPAIVDGDLPDMVFYVSPCGMALPAEHYDIHVEPMKAVIERGPLVNELVSLLSRSNNDTTLKSNQIGIETSGIDASITVEGDFTCSQFDLFLGGKLHVVSWGNVDWIHEDIDMILGIPATTLQDTLNLSNLPADYCLKIPIKGTFDQPRIDWKSAGHEIVQLALYKSGNQFLKGIVQEFYNKESIPEPKYPLPLKSREHANNKAK